MIWSVVSALAGVHGIPEFTGGLVEDFDAYAPGTYPSPMALFGGRVSATVDGFPLPGDVGVSTTNPRSAPNRLQAPGSLPVPLCLRFDQRVARFGFYASATVGVTPMVEYLDGSGASLGEV
ncbi:MAG: hypothetical protein KC656_29990, partial [Myxococcales bacterium]|nr:hypothetical protein [Myxococcales bacterium]